MTTECLEKTVFLNCFYFYYFSSKYVRLSSVNVIKLKHKMHLNNPVHLFIIHIIASLIKQNLHCHFSIHGSAFKTFSCDANFYLDNVFPETV